MKSKLLLKIISFVGLFLTIIPSFFVFNNLMKLDTGKLLMLIGTIIWFVLSPFWINKSTNT